MVAHAALTGAELHEPKGVASATAKTVYVANGSGSGSWTTLDYASLPNGTVIDYQYAQNSTASTQSTTIPLDNTVPQNTEGTEVFTVTITPKSTTSILTVRAVVNASEAGNTSTYVFLALFKDSEASARAVSSIGMAGAPAVTQGVLEYSMVAGTTSTITFKIRAGSDSGGSWYLNKSYNGETMGGVFNSFLSVTETKAS